MTAAPLYGQLFRWTVERSARSFRVFTVEPSRYQPDQHAAIFNAVLTALLRPDTVPEDLYRQRRNFPAPVPFDLVTFPEAFLATDDLIRTLTQLAAYSRMGCVHVGLRSSQNIDSHLVGTKEFRTIIEQLSALPDVDSSDFEAISSWLDQQANDSRFNVGCLFLLDAEGKLRVCLHPKMVRSKFELGVLADDRMTEANLLSLVTLLPDTKKFLTVTIQPIICSDALQLDVDNPGQLPLNCLNDASANSFPDTLPDHVDVVSVAACTPQHVGVNNEGEKFRKWHEDFCATFERIGTGGWHRHYHATFVLSNFLTVPTRNGASATESPGGLSGGFIPMRFASDRLPAFAQLTAFGKVPDDADNRWADPVSEPNSAFKSRGYIAHLAPKVEEGVAAKMFGFVVTTFPRDTPHWKANSALADFQLRVGRYDGKGGVTFIKGDA